MSLVRLRHIAEVNPLTPAFDRLTSDDELTFLPMESVWPGARLDISRRRSKESVAIGYTRFQDGDVLVPKITPTFEAGRAVLISGLLGGVGAGSTELHVLRSGTRIDPRFLLYTVNTHSFLKLGKAQMYGVAGQQRVPDSFLRDLPVDLPSLTEQRRIADFLDAETARMDTMLALTQRFREVMNERNSARKSLILRGADKAGGRTDHPMLGNLPEGWKVKPLRRLVPRIGVGVVVDPSSYFADKGVPFLRGSNVLPGKFRLGDVRRISEADSRRLWRSQLFEGDIVVVRAGDPGRAAVVTQDLNGANCASILVLKKGNILLPAYLAAYFNSALGAAYVDSVRYGAAQEQINVSHVVDFMVPVPSISEQESIIKELDRSAVPGLSMERLLEKQSEILGERRQALITAAVTGQIDVSTASGRGIED